MPTPTFQNQVNDFVNVHDLEIPVADRLLDLVSEIGEVAKEILKSTEYGKHPFGPGEGWEDEIGDVFFSLVCIANSTGVDLLAVLEAALSKYENRLCTGSDPGS